MKNFLRNARFVRKQWRQLPMDKLAWLWTLLYMLMNGVSAVLAVLVPARAIIAVQNQTSFSLFLLLVAALGLALMLTRLLKSKTYFNNFFFRISESASAGSKSINLPAELMEGPTGEEFRERISYAIWQGNETGIEAFLTNWRDIFVSLINTALYIFLSARLEWTWLPLILLPSVGQGIFLFFVRKKNYQETSTQETFWTKRYYLRTMALKNEAGKDVRLFPMAELFKKKFAEYGKEWMQFFSRMHARRWWTNLTFWLLCLARDIVCFIILFKRVQAGMPVADFVLYTGVILGISAYVREIFVKTADLDFNNHIVDRYREVMETPGYDQGEYTASLKPGLHTITFENVSYCYPSKSGEELWALKDINLTIRAGEKLALVGMNGAGKTTLVKLAAGIYQPTQGRVLYDGVDIRTINPRDLFERIAVVFQEVSIIATTLAENIACRPAAQIDRERLEDAIRKADLGEVVSGLKQGTESQLTTYLHSDGVVLSGGENQRLMLARALYKGGDLLILDEPTAALDPLAEASIYEKYYDLSKNQTAIFISHRLSSTQFCDRVIFLEEGRIAETGTHQELMRARGAYQHMFQEQAKYYQSEAAA